MIAEAATIASGSFILYFLRSSIVLFLISLVRDISSQSFKSDFIQFSSVSVIPEYDKSSISEITENARVFCRYGFMQLLPLSK